MAKVFWKPHRFVSYLNPMFRFGLDKLAKRAAEEYFWFNVCRDLRLASRQY